MSTFNIIFIFLIVNIAYAIIDPHYDYVSCENTETTQSPNNENECKSFEKVIKNVEETAQQSEKAYVEYMTTQQRNTHMIQVALIMIFFVLPFFLFWLVCLVDTLITC